MKLRIYKSYLTRVLLWYTNQLYQKYVNRPFSPAVIELIQRDLRALQIQMQKTETNPVWSVPVTLSIDLSRNIFEVVVADESNLLYLHEEN